MKKVSIYILMSLVLLLSLLPKAMAGRLPFFGGVQVSQSFFAQGARLVIQNEQEASQLVQNELGGKVLRVSETMVNGKPGYSVKLLKDNGHVIYVSVDASLGRIVD